MWNNEIPEGARHMVPRRERFQPGKDCSPCRKAGTGFGCEPILSYCFEPVVALFGFGEQFRFCGFASFSQAAMLAYLQFRPPLLVMQNGEFPTVCALCMPPPGGGEVICACAKETPAMSAATAVSVVNVFIV